MNKWLDLMIALLFATVTVVAAVGEESLRGGGGTPSQAKTYPRAAEEDLDEEEMREAREEEHYNLYEQGQRKLQSPTGNNYASEYAIVIEDQHMDLIMPQPLFAFTEIINKRPNMLNGRSENDIVGMKTMTKGVVLDPVAVTLEEQITRAVDNENLFAGGVQPVNTRPRGNPAFFMTGICTVTAQGSSTADDGQLIDGDTQVFMPWIRAQQCHYDLCLGDQGNSCVNFYGGGGYIFNPYERISIGDASKSIINNNNLEPMLPPPFDMVILGGTGAYRLVKGSATLTTVAGQTRGSIQNDIARRGSIVQILQISSNIPLRQGPKEDGGTSAAN